MQHQWNSLHRESNLKKQLDQFHANTKLTERAAGSEKRKNVADQSAGQDKATEIHFLSVCHAT